VRETADQVLFLHRVEPGGADRSYGIEVGRLAGLPDGVIHRARQVLRLLESEQLVRGERTPAGGKAASWNPQQLALFDAQQPHPVVDRLKGLDPNATTPLQALALLAQLVEEAKHPRG
jgi:DNA mismatch repair protein MutS